MNWEQHDTKMLEGIQAYRNEIRQQVMRQVPAPWHEEVQEAKTLACVANMRQVVHATAAALDIPVDRILSRSHQWHLVEAREVICFILHPKYSLSQIGRILNRHHTTIMHTVRQAKKKYQDSPAFREAVELVKGGS